MAVICVSLDLNYLIIYTENKTKLFFKNLEEHELSLTQREASFLFGVPLRGIFIAEGKAPLTFYIKFP